MSDIRSERPLICHKLSPNQSLLEVSHVIHKIGGGTATIVSSIGHFYTAQGYNYKAFFALPKEEKKPFVLVWSFFGGQY